MDGFLGGSSQVVSTTESKYVKPADATSFFFPVGRQLDIHLGMVSS